MHDGRPEGRYAGNLALFDRSVGRSWNARFGPVQVQETFTDRFPEPRAKTRAIPPQRQRRGRPAKGPVSTYVIGIEGSPLVKIGYTSVKPRERCQALQTGLPFDLTLLWSTPGEYETRLHDMFAEHRVRGEWFDLTPLGDPLQVVQSAVAEIRVHDVTRES